MKRANITYSTPPYHKILPITITKHEAHHSIIKSPRVPCITMKEWAAKTTCSTFETKPRSEQRSHIVRTEQERHSMTGRKTVAVIKQVTSCITLFSREHVQYSIPAGFMCKALVSGRNYTKALRRDLVARQSP